MSGRRAKKRRNTPLTSHRQYKKSLKPPFAQIPGLVGFDSVRDLLPELLWIDALIHSYTFGTALSVIDEVLDVLDEVDPPGERKIRLGLVSDFLLSSATTTQVVDALDTNTRMMSFPNGFLEAVLLYPEFPGRYLFADLSGNPKSDGRVFLSGAVLRLANRHAHEGALRNAIAFRRAIDKGYVMGIPKRYQEPMTKYPNGSDDENGLVESLARSYINGTWGLRKDEDQEWAKHFWRTNREIAPCKTRELPRPTRIHGVDSQLQGSV